jgi:predicted aldo/keto reductase-like oxidoreductase
MPQITIKVNSTAQTADAAVAAACKSLDNMGLQSAEWFVCWGIKSYSEFEQVTAPGGVYDGAVRLKAQGLIRRISVSLHAPPDDAIRILESGLFEAVTLSVNVLNYTAMKPVLRRAGQSGIPVIVMNPLAGGVIPQTADFFSFLRQSEGESVSVAAMRFLLAYDEIKCVLSGVSSAEELSENIQTTHGDSVPREARITRVEAAFCKIDGFCTGCRYCDGCPNGIDVCRLMQAYNALLFPIPNKLYNARDRRVLENIQICSKLSNTYHYLPEMPGNPCVSCGQCEGKCTAKLAISRRMAELYGRFEECGYSRSAQLDRLRELAGDAARIALYPGGGYASYVLAALREAFGGNMPAIFLFDGNAKLHGTFNSGIEVRSPDAIASIAPEVIIVANYIYGKEIYEQIKHYEDDITADGTPSAVKMLHNPSDVPWVF